MGKYIENPKLRGSGILGRTPQSGRCLVACADCFFQSGRSYLEPLDENTPNIPSRGEAFGRVVRINDGNDSNNDRELVIKTAEQFQDYFFNTSIPKDIGGFGSPTVLTANPAKMTDTSFHKLDPVPLNLMFVRARVNMWNLDLIDDIVEHYTTMNSIPTVLTFMAYYAESIPEEYKHMYTWRQRVLNSYYVLNAKYIEQVKDRYKNLKVYLCSSGACRDCGHCLREYYSCKEKIRKSMIV